MPPRARIGADCIAASALGRAAAAASAGAAFERGRGGGAAERLAALAEACAHLSSGDQGLPRRAGLEATLVLRDAAAALLDEGAPYALDLHQGIDAAATALGAAPDGFDDPDDWRLPDPVERIPLIHLAPTAATACDLAHGLDALCRRIPGGGLLAREAEALRAATLALRAACLSPAGAPAVATGAVARRAADAARRLCEVARASQGTDPSGPLGRAASVVETSGLFAAEVLAEIEVGAAAPGPGR